MFLSFPSMFRSDPSPVKTSLTVDTDNPSEMKCEKKEEMEAAGCCSSRFRGIANLEQQTGGCARSGCRRKAPHTTCGHAASSDR
jgi:hypothetical protein